MMDSQSMVKVAVRVRPLLPDEIAKGCKEIVETIEENDQILIKSNDKTFSFNYVLGTASRQEELYQRCVQPMLKNLFEGVNVTIFAYGQMGSGKTHSMGTTSCHGEDNMGVIPRAVNEIFNHVHNQSGIDFTITVTVSFMELFSEVLFDLLSNKQGRCVLKIREDVAKGIQIPRLTEVPVKTASEVLGVLIKGSVRKTRRSHSIFAINIAMQHKADKNQNKSAKLHLVDLVGSERPTKTKARGTTVGEVVDNNEGLCVLGEVISALGDEKLKDGFIPYGKSNLTRLLKDSLGGNSVTLMIACISPADYNLDETLSTLRYADRARKIKNKPVVIQSPTAKINALQAENKQLQLQMQELQLQIQQLHLSRVPSETAPSALEQQPQPSTSTNDTTQLSDADSIPQTSEHLSCSNAASTSSTSQGAGISTSVPSVTTPSALELNKQQMESHLPSTSASLTDNTPQIKRVRREQCRSCDNFAAMLRHAGKHRSRREMFPKVVEAIRREVDNWSSDSTVVLNALVTDAFEAIGIDVKGHAAVYAKTRSFYTSLVGRHLEFFGLKYHEELHETKI